MDQQESNKKRENLGSGHRQDLQGEAVQGKFITIRTLENAGEGFVIRGPILMETLMNDDSCLQILNRQLIGLNIIYVGNEGHSDLWHITYEVYLLLPLINLKSMY
jgi:hypothetical protein